MFLDVRIWTFKDLAKWFGIKPNTFSKQKQDRLEELKEYADYEITDGGKVDIFRVKKYFYKKDPIYQYYKKQILSLEDKVVEYHMIAKRFYKQNFSVHVETCYFYVKQIYEDILIDKIKYQLCMVVGDRLEPFGIWAYKIYEEEYNKYFQFTAEERFILQSKIANREILEEDACNWLFSEDKCRSFIRRLCTIFNCDAIVNGVVVKDIKKNN